MKYIKILLLTISIISYSSFIWAATCENCYQMISKGERYCEFCDPYSPRNIKSGEEQIVGTINISRENYKTALTKLIQYYLDIGYQLRLKKARMELKALNKVPQLRYLAVKDEVIPVIRPVKNIEAANILFQDGKMYKKSLCFIKKKSHLLSAIVRFKTVINDYAESDKTDDAAYELAEIFEKIYFKDYESAAYYYVKCYELNPNTHEPARYMAGRIYDKFLKDYDKAIQNYESALKTCRIENYRKIAKERLDELRKQRL